MRFRQCIPNSFQWIAGQHVEFLPELKSQTTNYYSIACAPRAPHFELEFAVALPAPNEPPSPLLSLHIGEKIEARAPQGSFVVRQRASSSLLIATGTGVAPLRAMIQQHFSQPVSLPTALLFGCRSEDDILWKDEFEHRTQTEPNFSFKPVLSRAHAPWTGLRGYVQEHAAELFSSLATPRVYVCGRRKMVEEVRTILAQEKNFSEDHFRCEYHK